MYTLLPCQTASNCSSNAGRRAKWTSVSFFSHFSTIDAVLHGARHMVAMEIAYEPLVRQAVQQAFSKNAVLHVKLTKKGRKVSFFNVHY